ncbi:Serine/threonine-protein kinase PknD [Sinobacterium norvegicum]|uniref:non-specific serine/threonine protein kinase n=1 Tax=Sinobacterium norvegicum TaxID=1641715 RepID=A0ABM9ACX6_9GAMM|nr:bifunctional protein-serine/threonine kinase/phosphatase [Sinobacterium norvegicum]CAH0991057.1 Serine/threonine-protein kinase PknD [Sinobacterium norvegicum]
MHLDGQLILSAAQRSEAGVKPQNEDSIGISIPDTIALTTKGAVIAIADGVSAAEAGKEASETCVRNFIGDYFATPESWTVKKSAHQVLVALNRWLYGQGQSYNNAERGYISTLSVLILKSRVGHIFHVGDSRIYRVRDGELEQLTRDHATRISKEQSYLTRAMGLDVRLDVDYKSTELRRGDVFVLTTDGIHDVVADDDILALAQQPVEQYEQQCQQLIALALSRGSKDNLSCQVIRVDDLPKEDANDLQVKLTDLPFPPFLEPGMVIDGFKIEREIHASNRSQLYIVEQVATGQRYCMKTPSVNFDDDPAYIERFIMESWIGNRIDNAQVVKVANNSVGKNFLYYLTELVDGVTLGRWMESQQQATIEQLQQMLPKIIKGVRAFHRKDMLHQDIKPDNILVAADESIKIVDFGSCFVGGIAEISAPIIRDIALGTANYSAPEYMLKRTPSALSDQFSVAVIAYQMLTGEQPYQGKLEHTQSLKQFSNLKYIPAYHYNPLVPVWIDGAIKKALSISPELRYQDISEFEYDLLNPNSQFLKEVPQAWVERNPVRFWQASSAVLLVSQLIMAYYLLR